MGHFFDEAYREERNLPDGTRMRLRLLRRNDRNKIVSGFRRLSPESRYRRFFTQLDELPEAMLTHLIGVDGHDHLALVAARLDARGRERYIAGVARFLRSAEDPEVAEASVAVVDSLQRQGLGSLLCRRLMAAAAERGVRRFRSHVLGENVPMRALLRKAFPGIHYERDGPLLVADLELPEVAHPGRLTGPQVARVLEFLRLAARGALRVRTALDRLLQR